MGLARLAGSVMGSVPPHSCLLSCEVGAVAEREALGNPVVTCHPSTMELTFYCFLWARPGMEQALIAYEDAVLTLVDEHDGRVVHRARTDGADGRPLEIQLFEWASQEAMDSYMSDPRRTARSADREEAIARTEFVPVRPI
jgi:hypothetical protein